MNWNFVAVVLVLVLVGYWWYRSKAWPWSLFRRCPHCGRVLEYKNWRQRYCPFDGSLRSPDSPSSP